MRVLRLSFAWVRLGTLFLVELTLSTWTVIRAVISPEMRVRSAFAAVPLDVRSDAGIVLLADLISLTPGTTSLHVSDDRKTLYVHVMDTDDAEEASRGMKRALERPVLEVLS